MDYYIHYTELSTFKQRYKLVSSEELLKTISQITENPDFLLTKVQLAQAPQY